MTDATLRLAVISADQAFRSTIAEVLHAYAENASVVADLVISACDLTSEVMDSLQADDPEVLLIDFSGGAASGVRLLRQLTERGPARTLIGTGPLLTPELLLEAMKAGITEYLPAPVQSEDLVDALLRALRRIGRGNTGAQSSVGTVVTFVGAKGGTGVTTATVNAGLHLHRLSKARTLLLDMNLEGGNLAVAMGLKPRYSLADLLENFHRVDESLLSSLVIQHASGVHVLAAPILPESMPPITADQARAVLRLLRRHFGMVLVDLGRPYSDYGRAVLESSDSVCLFLVPDVLAIHGAKRLLPLLRQGADERDRPVRVVLNRVGSDDQIQKHDVQQALQMDVAHLLRRDDAGVLASLNTGKPITMNGSRSRYAKDVKTLCALVSSQDAHNGDDAGTLARLMGAFTRRTGRGRP